FFATAFFFAGAFLATAFFAGAFFFATGFFAAMPSSSLLAGHAGGGFTAVIAFIAEMPKKTNISTPGRRTASARPLRTTVHW
ncbi:MAG: hypothetical protein HN919_06520, partial [Verrucomicrobia bacterium]|nr:hypothetical protein [Verrucomicrobiota bacterium]